MKNVIYFIFIFVCIMILGGCVHNHQAHLNQPTIQHNYLIDKTLSSTTQIRVPYFNNAMDWGSTVGTAFVIHNEGKYSYLLTDYHVFEFDPDKKHCVISHNGVDYYAELIMGDKQKDIALVQSVRIRDAKPAKLNYYLYPPLCSTVVTTGFPVTLGEITTKGSIARYYIDGDKLLRIQVHSTDTFGGSGSALFDNNAEVIGIFQLVPTERGQNMYSVGIYLSSYDIVKWLFDSGYGGLVNKEM